MKTCIECGKNIPDYCLNCEYCGKNQDEWYKKKDWYTILFSASMLLIIPIFLIGNFLINSIKRHKNKPNYKVESSALNSLFDGSGNVKYQEILKLKNLNGLTSRQKGIISDLEINCKNIKNLEMKEFVLDVQDLKNISKINESLSYLYEMREILSNVGQYKSCYRGMEDLFYSFGDIGTNENLLRELDKFKYNVDMWYSVIQIKYQIPFSFWLDSCTEYYQYLLSVQNYIYYDDEGMLNCIDDDVYDNLLNLSENERLYRNRFLELFES